MAIAGRLPLFHVVGFTGHRQLADPAEAASAIREALDALRGANPGRVDCVLVDRRRRRPAVLAAGARPWPVLACHPAAVACGIRHRLYARRVVKGGKRWPPRITCTSSHENGDREDAYLDCGIETVNGADVLLAVWDGDSARGKGGTADVVEYARSIGKPVMIIDAVTHEIRRENWDRLAAQRRRPGRPERPVGSGERLGRTPSRRRTPSSCSSRSAITTRLMARRGFRRLIVVDGGVARRRDGDRRHRRRLRTAPAGAAVDRTARASTFALGAAIWCCAINMHSHHSWVRCRLAAEFCRSALATWGLPRAAPLLHHLDLAGARGLDTLAVHPAHALVRAAARVDRGVQANLSRQANRRPARLLRQAGESRDAALQAADGGFSVGTIFALVFTAFYAITRTLHTAVAGVGAGDDIRIPADRPAGRGGCLHLHHFDQRPAAPRGTLPGNAGDARDQPRPGGVQPDLEQRRTRRAQDRARAPAGR